MILLPTQAAAAKTVAIVPFKINADKDMNYLRDGVADMLSSRLHKAGEVEVLNRQAVEKALPPAAAAMTEESARELARRAGADFVLFGSITAIGNSISMDAKMVDAAGARPTMSFFEQSEDAGGIISKINAMAAEINREMFGRAAAARPGAAAPPAAAAQPPAVPDAQAHPEKMFRQRGGLGGEEGGSPFVSEEGGRVISPQFWKSASFKQLFNGIALGDVDGDGKIETLILTPEKILLFRYDQQRFHQVTEIADFSGKYCVGIDVADINGNGIPEIFVTSMPLSRKMMNSFVVEWDGKAFKTIADNLSYYFRVVDLPARGRLLIGQEHRSGNPFTGRISEMIWRNGRYEADTEIRAGASNALGLTIAEILEKGTETAAAYDSFDRIRIFEGGGQELWRSADQYGGSTLFYSGTITDQGEIENPIYFPMRLLTARAGKEQKSVLLAVKNFDIAGRKLGKFRSFSESQVIAFFWDGLGLSPEWKTRKFSGYIRDFAVGDFNNDGSEEIVCAVVLDEGRVVTTTPKSTVIVFEMIK
ncbi:MAG: FG-GAP-like repeat-containing protein [Desulfobacterales bacterium]|nr:FG-GAP-like repeat-containing protein [Desulfobacterales bacterium]